MSHPTRQISPHPSQTYCCLGFDSLVEKSYLVYVNGLGQPHTSMAFHDGYISLEMDGRWTIGNLTIRTCPFCSKPPITALSMEGFIP